MLGERERLRVGREECRQRISDAGAVRPGVARDDGRHASLDQQPQDGRELGIDGPLAHEVDGPLRQRCRG